MTAGSDRGALQGKWLLARCGFRQDILDRILHGPDSREVGIRDIDAERFLEGDDKLNGVEAVGAEILDQGGIRDDHVRIDAKMTTDDQHNFCSNVGQTLSLPGWSKSSICMPNEDRRCAIN